MLTLCETKLASERCLPSHRVNTCSESTTKTRTISMLSIFILFIVDFEKVFAIGKKERQLEAKVYLEPCETLQLFTRVINGFKAPFYMLGISLYKFSNESIAQQKDMLKVRNKRLHNGVLNLSTKKTPKRSLEPFCFFIVDCGHVSSAIYKTLFSTL